MISKTTTPARLQPSHAAAATVAACLLLLAGCGGHDNKDKTVSQTAAKVNKEEITVHQINFVLQQQRGLKPEQTEAAGRQILENLIDQELAVQKATDIKLDRDPHVVQAIEAARRELLARAYAEKIGSQAPKPSPAEVSQYYAAHPELFSNRKIYNLQEYSVEGTPDRMEALKTKLAQAKDIKELVGLLNEGGYKYAVNQAVRAAEQLPLASLPQLSQQKDGGVIWTPTPTGAQIVIVGGTRVEPVDEERAKPAIEQFLFAERQKKVVSDDVKALRTAAKVEYVGSYAKNAPSKASEPSPTEVKETKSPLTATPASDVAPTVPVRPASMPQGNTLEQGLKGLK